MGIFTISSVYILIKGLNSGKLDIIKLIIAGSLIFLVGLSKGFVALFPLATIYLFWMVNKEQSLKKIITSSVILISIPLLLLIITLLNDDANQNLSNYFDIQVLKSIAGERKVVSNRM